MITVVLGAGATRGASFVPSLKGGCLPPLNSDFFGQLQRTGDRGYADEILPAVRQLFGTLREPTLEEAFCAFEQGLRLANLGCFEGPVEMWKEELQKGHFLLYKALQTVFVNSLTEKIPNSFPEHRQCDYHKALARVLKSGDTIISFNYDCLMDETLNNVFAGAWEPKLGYGFHLEPTSPGSVDATLPSGILRDTKARTPRLLKLHGSMNFDVRYIRNRRCGMRFMSGIGSYLDEPLNPDWALLLPQSTKSFDNPPFDMIWTSAARAIQRTKEILIIGYSFSNTDSHADMLFRLNVGTRFALNRLIIVNPDPEARSRARSVLHKGIGHQTKIVELPEFSEISSLLTQRQEWIEMEQFRKRSERVVQQNLRGANARLAKEKQILDTKEGK